MQLTTLGRTALQVSVAGLGCGGHSRLGLRHGKGEDNAIRVVQAALDLGVTLIDTAVAYGTEDVVGRALEGRRHGVALSSKILARIGPHDAPYAKKRRITEAEIRQIAEESLRRLRTDCIDILFIHGVAPEDYVFARDEVAPVYEALRAEGKIRFIAMSERFSADPTHKVMYAAIEDSIWDVTMPGYNIVNHSAGRRILPALKRNGVGTLGAFAVRRALANPERARDLVEKLIAAGEVDPSAVDRDDPLGFLVSEGGARDLVDGAYRFARHADGIDVVLTGTGDVEHLRANIASINALPLHPEAMARIHAIFGRVDSVAGD